MSLFVDIYGFFLTLYLSGRTALSIIYARHLSQDERFITVRRLGAGVRPAQIASFVCRSQSTVYSVRDYSEKDKPNFCSGRPGKLSHAEYRVMHGTTKKKRDSPEDQRNFRFSFEPLAHQILSPSRSSC